MHDGCFPVCECALFVYYLYVSLDMYVLVRMKIVKFRNIVHQSLTNGTLTGIVSILDSVTQ